MRRIEWTAVALIVCGVAASAATARGLDSLRISNTSSTPVKAQTVLQAGHRYRLVVTGTVSDWCPATAKKAADCSYGSPFEVGKGVDAVWCYAAWRCPTKEVWQQLNVNGRGILD